jgi:3-mercaptopropionate dioxygenase
MTTVPQLSRLRDFVQHLTRTVEAHGADEAALLAHAQPLLVDLISHDDWLPEAYARANPERYQQYLLYCDPFERFSVASFVWGPGHTTPVHDHTVWGMVGVMRGAEKCEEYSAGPLAGAHAQGGARFAKCGEHRVTPGQVDLVSPTIGDIHKVSNAYADRVSVSIHVYGANIGTVQRHVYDEATGQRSGFVSGYVNSDVPNLWAS